MKRFLGCLLGMVLVAAVLAGDDPPKKDKSKDKDPQASFEPRSKPGAGQKFLEKFVGDWDVQ